jgi:uncharacterized protein YhaN
VRFRRLDLIAFGHFTDVSLELQRHADLHLVYGGNEAGKTTALRAIHELLYGIPVRTDLAFLHPMNRLRVGAVVEGPAGETLEVVRRKGRVDTLRTPGDEVVEESRLTALLGGVGPQLFRTMFGLDHPGLLAGGEELLRGEGEVGQSLFGAAVGAGRVHTLLVELERQAAEIYRPRGSRPLNQAIGDYDAARRRIRELQLRPQRWQELNRALEAASAVRERRERRVVEQDAGLRRLQRLQAALPLLARRERLAAEAADLAGAPDVPAAVIDGHRRVVDGRRAAAEREREARAQLADADGALAGIVIDGPLLARAAEVRRLAHGRGRYEKDGRDRDALRGTQSEAISQAGALLRQVWPDVRVEDADRDLRLTTTQRDRLETAIAQHPLLVERQEQARRAAARVDRELARRRELLLALGTSADPSDLRRALDRCRADGALRPSLGEAGRDLAGAEREAADLLGRLGLGGRTAEAAAALPVPVRERVTHYQLELARLRHALETTGARVAEVEARRDDLRLVLRELELTGRVPSTEELDRARARRDEGWALVLQAWMEGRDVAAAVGAYGGSAPLPVAYAEAVASADEVADGLRDAGERVVKGAQARAGLEACERDLGTLGGARERLEGELRGLEERWLAEWAQAGVVPGAAEQMQGWLDRHARLVVVAAHIAELRGSIALARERLETHAGGLAAALVAVGLPARQEAAGEALDDLEARAAAEVERLSGLGRQRQDLVAACEELQARRREHEDELAQAAAALAGWEAGWREALEPLRLPASTPPGAAAVALRRLGEAIVKVDESNVLRRRREGIRLDMERYEAQVRAVVEAVAPDLAGLPAPAAAAELEERVARGREASTLRAEKLALRERLQARLEAQGRALRQGAAELEELERRLGAGSPDELDRLVEAAVRLRGVRQELERCESELLQQGAGWTIEEHVRQAAGTSPELVAAEIAAAEERLAALRREHEDAVRAEAEARAELQRLDGSGAAAEMAVEAQEHRARVLAEAARFSRLAVARAILGREIELYRERHQAPLLRRAGETFREITLGRYVRLKAESDGGERVVIVGVTPDGDERSVAQMSAGTRDQLYLALRLATLADHVERGPAMPVVLDDILINFDDDRTRATLQVLAAVSRRTQVLLFTHHSRLLDIARAALPPGAFVEHALPPGGRAGEPAVSHRVA